MAFGGLGKDWYCEVNEQWPGIACSLQVEEILWDQKSKYQHVQVFKSKTFGNVLVLDGVIQITEKDESAYQEMLTHVPMFSHPNPEHVLIVGGGDGGIIREVAKHASVKSITICEIDQMVIDCGKKFFPSIANTWDDPRVTLVCGDAAVYMKTPEVKGKFDVIICDSSDPVGPAEALFELPFYKCMNDALRDGGKIGTQAESMWMHLDLIKRLITQVSAMFASCEYTTTQIPTYPCGQIGLLICSREDANAPMTGKGCRTPVRPVPESMLPLLKYYSTELHPAAFVLPAFVANAIEAARAQCKALMAAGPAAAAQP